jgi:hypothetical protein
MRLPLRFQVWPAVSASNPALSCGDLVFEAVCGQASPEAGGVRRDREIHPGSGGGTPPRLGWAF